MEKFEKINIDKILSKKEKLNYYRTNGELIFWLKKIHEIDNIINEIIDNKKITNNNIKHIKKKLLILEQYSYILTLKSSKNDSFMNRSGKI